MILLGLELFNKLQDITIQALAEWVKQQSVEDLVFILHGEPNDTATKFWEPFAGFATAWVAEQDNNPGW
jgi:hypothetical protein